jgi:hypothetical protein
LSQIFLTDARTFMTDASDAASKDRDKNARRDSWREDSAGATSAPLAVRILRGFPERRPHQAATAERAL